MVAQHTQRDVVGTEVAAVDDLLRLETQRGLVGDFVTEQVAGGDVFKLEFLGHLLGLGAFAAAGGTEHDDVDLFHIVGLIKGCSLCPRGGGVRSSRLTPGYRAFAPTGLLKEYIRYSLTT